MNTVRKVSVVHSRFTAESLKESLRPPNAPISKNHSPPMTEHLERQLRKTGGHNCPFGWGTDQRGFGEEPGMKTQMLNLIRSIRTVMRIPLIGINVAVILFKLVLG